MNTEMLLVILIALASVVGIELLVLIFQMGRLLKKEPAAGVVEERKEVTAARVRSTQSASGSLKRKSEAEPKVDGLRICPRCYSAISTLSTECPACKNPLR